MEQVTIFGRSSCGFCTRARQLCEINDLHYRYVDIEAEGISKSDLSQTIGKPVYTVPQIFVGQEHVGGFDHFSAYLARAGASTG
ncbi:GrxA family glutaredoxin [Marinobacter confluentis]|uniref:GrxA family glutaredoxin n=1 Tax=Marinobacter confluentis TaxID=1697557 RepID=A0A4Z1BM00_9GAMM|nr:GrxA family glutaredoxin [Marinobacter confluentis]TGN38194.1 GrxA family glutaredoxin [Marinobacter confluentis]